MNKRQVLILYCALGVLVLMLLVPPWEHVTNPNNLTKPGPYRPLVDPPGGPYPRVDLTRLGLQVAAVIIVTGGLLSGFKTRPKQKEDS